MIVIVIFVLENRIQLWFVNIPKFGDDTGRTLLLPVFDGPPYQRKKSMDGGKKEYKANVTTLHNVFTTQSFSWPDSIHCKFVIRLFKSIRLMQANICLFKLNNRNICKVNDTCSKLTSILFWPVYC